jgi:hypothetical protein
VPSPGYAWNRGLRKWSGRGCTASLDCKVEQSEACNDLGHRLPGGVLELFTSEHRIVRARRDHLVGASNLEHLICGVKFA